MKNHWTITDDKNIKTSELLAEARKLFKVYFYDEENIDKEFPAPQKTTTRHFLANIEPDPKTLGKSVREVNDDKNGITLRERLIMEIQYFNETGKHLDIKGVTFCSGSRSSDGRVPNVYFHPNDGEVRVNWFRLDDARSGRGIRRAVSLDTSDTSLSLDPVEQSIKVVKEAGYEVIKRM